MLDVLKRAHIILNEVRDMSDGSAAAEPAKASSSFRF